MNVACADRTSSSLLFCFFLTYGAHADPLTPAEQTRWAQLESGSIQDYTNIDLADYLVLRNKRLAEVADRPSPSEEIARYALKQIDQPFRLHSKQFDLSQSDCVTFTERCIALACATTWKDYYLLSQRLRYVDGKIDVLDRNFFPLADWIPNNAWLLRDITQELGVEPAAFELPIHRRRFLKNIRYGLGSEPTEISDFQVQLGAYSTQSGALNAIVTYAQAGLTADAEQQLRGNQLLWIVVLRYPTHAEAVAGLQHARKVQPSARLTESSKAYARAARLANAPEVELLHVQYIPRNSLPEIRLRLHTGDIAFVIRQGQPLDGQPNLYCNHMGVILVEDDVPYLLHSIPGGVRREPLERFAMRFSSIRGFKFARLQDNAATHVADELENRMGGSYVPEPEQLDRR